MRSPSTDRTARATIRDEALGLFARYGPEAVSLRAVAQAAGVSPALIVRHYGSREGLRQAVDSHVLEVFGQLWARIAADGLPVSASLGELVVRLLPPDSPLPAYLGQLLLAGGPAARALFGQLYAASRATLDALVSAGQAVGGASPEVRAALLLANDLAVVMLRARLQEVLGADPLGPAGLPAWAAELQAIYTGGLRKE